MLCVALGGFVLFHGMTDILRIIALSVAALFLLLSVTVKTLRQARIPAASAAVLIISFFLSFIYFDTFFYPNRYYDTVTTIEGRIIDIDEHSKNNKTLTLKLSSIGDDNCSYKINLSLYGMHDVSVGEIIRCETVIEKIDSDGAFDFERYYTARGISGRAEATELLSVEEGRVPILYRFKEFRNSICDRAAQLSDSGAGSMLGALLLGERERLSGQVELDFERTGISHILALSGAHLSMLTLGFEGILRCCRVNKRWRILISTLFCFIFMAFTGFPVTICRAGFMMIISSVLYLISGSKDGITSLLLATSLLVAIQPYAALDIGLWLSVLATIGIILAAELIYKRYAEYHGFERIKRYLLTSLIFSLFSIFSTSTVCAFSFSTISLLSIITTLIFTLLVEVYVYVGIIALIIGGFIPIGKILSSMSSFICMLVAKFSDLPIACASTAPIAVKIILLILTVAFALFAILDVKKKRTAVALMAAMLISAFSVSLVYTLKQSEDSLLRATGNGSDVILLRTEKQVMLINVGTHRKGSGYDDANYLLNSGTVKIDCYFVANYTSYLPYALEAILSNISVSEIRLPMPSSDTEEQILIEAVKITEGFRVDISLYKEKEITSFGEYNVMVPYRKPEERACAITMLSDGNLTSYISKGTLDSIPESRNLLYVSNTLIFGSWGKTYEHINFIDELGEGVEKVVIFDDKTAIDIERRNISLPFVSYEKDAVLFD